VIRSPIGWLHWREASLEQEELVVSCGHLQLSVPWGRAVFEKLLFRHKPKVALAAAAFAHQDAPNSLQEH